MQAGRLYPEIVPLRPTKSANSVLLGMNTQIRPAGVNRLWGSTKYSNQFRYVPSGTIFARLKIRGKQLRKSLGTQDIELAKHKLIELSQP